MTNYKFVRQQIIGDSEKLEIVGKNVFIERKIITEDDKNEMEGFW